MLRALLPIAVLAGAAAVFMGREESDPAKRWAAARKAVRAKFTVAPDCQSVEYKGKASAAEKFWAGPMERYLTFILAMYAAGDPDPLNLSNEAMADLFREDCGGMPPRTPSWEMLYRAIELKIATMIGGG